ncbi:MAG: UDP-N-acetylmuramate-L-alanine ligase [Parcubacteria group bacterium GW2011_GWE1_43_8]|nr:MAG: UDP-N-acetylmuramate-L-alanine ligase [Parcubacteria group bacterium GW2011_GWE1_43_8]
MSKFNQAKRIYFIGLKGVGMTALAQLLKSRGVQVWGSDTEEQFFTDKVLAAAGIECEIGFSAKHLDRPIDLVIRSSAYSDDQVEVKAAKEKKIPVLSYAEALGELAGEYKSVAVCGSHGKTTISAMLAHVLKQANLSPSAIVGSAVPQFGGNALVGSGELLVFEADEYQNKLQYFSPQSVILTSIDWDHPDFFPSADDYFATFVTFLKKIPTDGFVVACYDSDNVKEAVDKAGLSPEKILTYGLTDGRLQMVRMWLDEGRWHFSATDGEEYLGEFWLKLVGSHNVANALAVIACARRLGVDLEAIRTGLASFEGTARRFENKGKLTNGITVVDDYAHHPGEIKATLKAARAFYPYKNIRCVFQPHTFSRTQALLADFGKSFAETDEVIVLDTYTSAREKTGEVTSAQLVEEIKKNHTNVIYKPTISEAVNYLMETTNRNNLVLTMGAGDVWQVGDKLIEKFGLLSGSEF